MFCNIFRGIMFCNMFREYNEHFIEFWTWKVLLTSGRVCTTAPFLVSAFHTEHLGTSKPVPCRTMTIWRSGASKQAGCGLLFPGKAQRRIMMTRCLSWHLIWRNDSAHLLPKESESARPRQDSELIHVISKAVCKLDLDWSAPEEAACSHLDKWFLQPNQKCIKRSSSMTWMRAALTQWPSKSAEHDWPGPPCH